jgi:hypothetical protein
MGMRNEGAKQFINNWFLVRNRARDEGPEVDLDVKEAALFGSPNWEGVPPEYRGSGRLKDYLSKVLNDNISKEFPEYDNILRSKLEVHLEARRRLGEPRTSEGQRKEYMSQFIKHYQTLVKTSLEAPGSLQDGFTRLRGEIRSLNENFAAKMREQGHFYAFVDLELDSDDEGANGALATFGKTRPEDGQRQICPLTPTQSPQRNETKTRKSRGSQQSGHEPIMVEIRKMISYFSSPELPGQVNSGVLPALYRLQISKWKSLAFEHYLNLKSLVEESAKNFLGHSMTKNHGTQALWTVLAADAQAMCDTADMQTRTKISDFCDQECTLLLQTTSPEFVRRVDKMRWIRFRNGLEQHNEQMRRANRGGEIDAQLLFKTVHPHFIENRANEVHDTLKVYYEVWMKTPRVSDDLSLPIFILHVL